MAPQRCNLDSQVQTPSRYHPQKWPIEAKYNVSERCCKPTWNKTSFAVPKGLTHCKATAAMADATNPFHITSSSFENVSNSGSRPLCSVFHNKWICSPSRPKSTPPKGLPNATDTPAAAAAASILRFRAINKIGKSRQQKNEIVTFIVFELPEKPRDAKGQTTGNMYERTLIPEI